MSNQNSTSGGFSFMTALIAIIICIGIAILIYLKVLGAPSNFDAEGHPLQGPAVLRLEGPGLCPPEVPLEDGGAGVRLQLGLLHAGLENGQQGSGSVVWQG